MELFIPSLIVLVLGAIVFFIVLPRMSPYTLALTAMALFGLGVWQHYSMFPSEYSSERLMLTVQGYAPFIMLGAVIFAVTVGIMVAFGVAPPAVTNALPAMPSMPAMPNLGLGNSSRPANNSKSIFNLGGNAKRNSLASTSFMTV
jgi:hypothetical protein